MSFKKKKLDICSYLYLRLLNNLSTIPSTLSLVLTCYYLRDCEHFKNTNNSGTKSSQRHFNP